MVSLKELRKSHYISQEDLAKLADTTASTINRLEKGKQAPRYGTIRKIAKALGVKPSDIEFLKPL